MLVRIPPKYSVSEIMGYLKGKNTKRIQESFYGRLKELAGVRRRYRWPL